MSDNKPANIEEYCQWLQETTAIRPLARAQSHYQSVTSKIKLDLLGSDFWKELIGSLNTIGQEYLMKTGYNLWTSPSPPELLVKPYDSLLLKTYRKNILENKRWDSPPQNGWILPENWFSRINDILRTLLVVKYLDGVEHVIQGLSALCQHHAMSFEPHLEARPEGYYAAHIYTRYQFEIPKVLWDTEKVGIAVEIQVTTQLQEVIRRLLHTYYEEKRRQIKSDAVWQWDYKSTEFATNYLGHILHYLEGTIMEIREKTREGRR